MTLPAGMVIGHLEPLEGCEVTTLEETGDYTSRDSQPICEGVREERVNLLSSVTGLDAEHKVWLCEALRLKELPIGLEEQDEVTRLIFKFQDVFALSDAELGITNCTHHHLDTEQCAPIKQYARRIPFSLQGPVEEAISDMLERKIIHPSSSPWASPVVFVKKKGGAYRFCVDYRKLNAVTKTQVYPLPWIEDALAGVYYFSTLDLASGFWQVPMHPDSIEKTAFVSHVGSYEFLVMPFGLKNAPATFQRLMADVLAGLSQEVCMDYIDDILIVGRSVEEHLKSLELVL